MRRKLIGTLAIVVVLGIAGFGQNIPPGALSANKPVFMAGRQVATTGASGDLLLALDPTKNYVVLHQECSRYEIVAVDSEEQKRCEREQQDATRTKDGCRRCEIAGWLIGGKWKPATNATSAMSTGAASSFPGSDFRITFFGQGGATYGGPAVQGATFSEINRRFDGQGGVLSYDPDRNITVNENGAAATFGGGVDVNWGWPIGGRAGVMVDTQRDLPRQTIRGRRSLNGLEFDQDGTADSHAVSLEIGPTLWLPGGVALTGGPALTWWSVETTQSAQLRALCPNPCQVVRTDNTSQEADGTDIGYFLGAEYYPRNSMWGLYFGFRRTTYEDVYTPTDPLGYPPNWTTNAWSVGVKVRTR